MAKIHPTQKTAILAVSHLPTCMALIRCPFCKELSTNRKCCMDRKPSPASSAAALAAAELYGSYRWKQFSKRMIAANPICQSCQNELSCHLHHCIKHHGDVYLFWHNEWACLCKECHRYADR